MLHGNVLIFYKIFGRFIGAVYCFDMPQLKKPFLVDLRYNNKAELIKAKRFNRANTTYNMRRPKHHQYSDKNGSDI